jgi:hypothetical protein
MDPFNQLPYSLSLVWKEGKKRWEDCTVKSRLGNELLVIYSGYRGYQHKRGGAHQMCSLSIGDNIQFEALQALCTGSAAQSCHPKYEFEIKTLLVARHILCQKLL